MSEATEIRWFKSEDSEGVYGITRARFQGKIYLGEEYWYLERGTEWRSNTGVRDWYFIGNDRVWEITESEAKTYLPPEALR